MFHGTMSNYKGCFTVNLPSRSAVVADTEGTVGTEDGNARWSSADDREGSKMKKPQQKMLAMLDVILHFKLITIFSLFYFIFK